MDGSLDIHDGVATVRFVRRLDHPPEKVWRAMTEPARLATWFPQGVAFDGDLAVGTRLRYSFGPEDDGRADQGFDGEVVEIDPPRLLVVTWGPDRLRFELADDGSNGTVLTFTDEFDEVGKAARDTAGWHVCLDGLTRSLEGEQADASIEDQWKTVHDGYVAAFPPEAATIGPPS